MKASEAKTIAERAVATKKLADVFDKVRRKAENGEFVVDVPRSRISSLDYSVLTSLGYRVTSESDGGSVYYLEWK